MIHDFEKACMLLRDYRTGKANANSLADALENLLRAVASRDLVAADVFDEVCGKEQPSELFRKDFQKGREVTECEKCAYYNSARFGPAVCFIIEEDPNAGVTSGGNCRYFCDVNELASVDEEPCFRKRKDDGSWRCVFEANTACLWNDGQGICLHEHPSSPAPLMEPEK